MVSQIPKQVHKAVAHYMNLFTTNIAEVKVLYSHKVKASDRIKITNSAKAAEIMREIYDESCQIELKEYSYLMLLNRANKVLGVSLLSVGGVSGCIVDPKIVFQTAIKTAASGIILCHNHPSGSKDPSKTDISLSKKIREGAKLLDISLLDHIILTSESYYSLTDNNDI